MQQQALKSQNKFVNLLLQNKQLAPSTFTKTIVLFALLGLVFVGLSVFFFIENGNVIQLRYQYFFPSDATSKCTIGNVCQVQVIINQTIPQPIYFMYEVGNFYQNHRGYIQSKSNYQLAGNIIQNSSQYFHVTKSWGGVTLDPNALASPCGSIARTYFNDTFQMYYTSNFSAIFINETGISWPGDKGGKYKRTQNSSSLQWVDPQNEHFIVWMRTSGLPNFKKLWGRIQSDLQPGNYTVRIFNNYDSRNWNGPRYIIFTTKGVLGGKNYLIPITFLVIGIFSLVISAAFFWKSYTILK